MKANLEIGILNQKEEAWTEQTEQTEDTFFVGSSIESHATAKWRPSILRRGGVIYFPRIELRTVQIAINRTCSLNV